MNNPDSRRPDTHPDSNGPKQESRPKVTFEMSQISKTNEIVGLEQISQISDNMKKETDLENSLRNLEPNHAEGFDTTIPSVITKRKHHQLDSDEHEDHLSNERGSSKRNDISGHVVRLRHDLGAAKLKLQSKSEKIKTLKVELAEAQRNLAACKDDLFRLQPVYQVSDSDIVNDFEMISQNIIKWIDDKIETIEESYIGGPSVKIFQIKSNREARSLLQHYPDCGEYYARRLIHIQLCEKIFTDSIAIFGLSFAQERLWLAVNDSLRGLQPPRGMVLSMIYNELI